MAGAVAEKKFQTQCDAIMHYCQAKFAEHQDTVVGLYTMGSSRYPKLLDPTRSLAQIHDSLQEIYPCEEDSELELAHALSHACFPLLPALDRPDRKARILLIIGGLTDLASEHAKEIGKKYRETGIAVDIVLFYLGDTPEDKDDEDEIYDSYYRQGRNELCLFFNLSNCNDNGRFLDVEGGSDICQLISDSMFKKTPRLPEKQNEYVGELELFCKEEAVSDVTEVKADSEL
uniref:uncharacterized protein LOC122601791 isoform X3 n=1 Tax=Erigeron canadensis TaxID=72917 RepID=UPI001CB9D69F|nr:uncharacterized protein LOC122601791 isoform X3 [Erigeron canadensis]